MFIFEMINASNTKCKKWPIIHVLFIIDRYRMELLCLCAYFGSLMAVRLGYDEIVGATVKTCKVSHMLYRGDTVIYCHQFSFVCKIKNFMYYLGRNIVSKAGLRLPISEDSVSRELEAWDTICKAKANWWFIVYLNFFNFCFSNTHNEFIYVQVCQNQIHFALIIASFFDWLHVFG